MNGRVALSVQPDPEEPAGGFAFLELPGGSIEAAQVTVAVQESFGDRWLAPAGDAAWQSARHEFGPYKVYRHDGADWVRIGPEIVDRMEEYTPVRLAIGKLTGEVVWPDDVLPRAGGAVLGGIRPVASGGAPSTVAAPMKPPPPPPSDPEPPEPDSVPEPDPDADAAPKRPRRWLPAVLVALLLVALIAAWHLIPDPPDPPEEVVAEPVSQPAPPDPGDACGEVALTALAGGFAARIAAIRDCGARVPPDLALRIIEDAAAGDDPQALLLFGTLYDGDELDPRIENLIGLSFDDDPAQAAVYYARAVAAGSDDARARLTATCARLAGGDTTLQKGAFHDHCR